MTEVFPFTIDVDQDQLDDLAARLAATRWPETEPVDDWSQGTPLAYAKELAGYWADGYDWRAR
ncbi:MAG: epoxide hydrolase N-terminal domain-containing protein, partial [Actinomycetota bacterium]